MGDLEPWDHHPSVATSRNPATRALLHRDVGRALGPDRTVDVDGHPLTLQYDYDLCQAEGCVELQAVPADAEAGRTPLSVIWLPLSLEELTDLDDQGIDALGEVAHLLTTYGVAAFTLLESLSSNDQVPWSTVTAVRAALET